MTRATQPFFWELAHQQGVQVGVFNYPLSYPPTPVSGYWVCGLNTPSRARDFIYPFSLAAELDFAVDVDIAGLSLPHYGRLSPRQQQAALQQITWLLRNHFTAGQRAIASVGAAPQLYVHVITATDRLFHLFWDALFDTSHPLAAKIAEFWTALDAGVRAWLEAAQPDVVLLVSDHGAAPAPQFAFSVDRWLMSLGVGQITGTEAFLRLPSAALLKRLLRRLLPAAASRLRDGREADALAFYARHWPAIPEVLYGPTIGITMNVRGRQPAGLLSPEQADELLAAIAAAARDLRDAEGQHIFQAVRNASEVWWGEYIARFPDLVLELAPPYGGAVGSSDQRLLFPVSGVRLGDHAVLGILGANRPLAYDAPVVWDVAGLVLDLLGAAVPGSLDSRAANHGAAHEVAFSLPQATFTAADTRIVEARLRRLGYVE